MDTLLLLVSIVIPFHFGHLGAFQNDRVVCDIIQENPVVRNQDKRPLIIGEKIFKPQGRAKIQIIRRLVEKKKVVRISQHLGKQGTHPPAAAQLDDRAVKIGRFKTQPHKDLLCLVLNLINSELFQFMKNVTIAIRISLKRILQFPFFIHKLPDPVISLGKFFHHCLFRIKFSLLRKITDIDIFLYLHVTRKGLHLSEDNGKECRFSGTIRAA